MSDEHEITNCPVCGLRVVLERHAGTPEDPHLIREHGDGHCADSVLAVITEGDLFTPSGDPR